MMAKEKPDVLSDVSKDFIEYFKSISVKEDAVPEEGIPDKGIPQTGMPPKAIPEEAIPRNGIPEEGIPDLHAVPETGIPDLTTPDKGIPESGTPIKKGIPRSDTPIKKGIPDEDTPIEDQSLSLALQIIRKTRDYILNSNEINPTEKLVMLYLIELSLSDNYLLPTSYNEISNDISTSKSAVVRCIKELQNKGFIKYIPGTNQLSASTVDVRGTYHKVMEQFEQSIQLTDFLDFWYTRMRYTSKRYSKELLLCLYVFKYKTNQHTELNTENGIPDKGIPGTAIPEEGIPESGTAKLRASTGDSIENILRYAIARGFDHSNINLAFINYMVESLEDINGDYNDRIEIISNFEREFQVAIEYTKKRDAKNPWNYIITCLKNGYTSSDDTIELRKTVKQYADMINRYINYPEEIELLGLDDLLSLNSALNTKLDINAKNASYSRSKLKEKVEEVKSYAEEVKTHFGLKFGSRTAELFNKGK